MDELRTLLSTLPELSEYLEGLDRLRKTDLSHASSEQIATAFYDATMVLPMVAVKLAPGEINAFTLFRARWGINEDEENVSLIRTHSYPSSTHCGYRGRANLKWFPVFYSSDLPRAAIAESRPTKGVTLFLSRWRIACPRIVWYMGFMPGNLPNSNPWYDGAVQQQLHYTAHVLRDLKGTSAHMEHLYQTVAQLFSEEAAPYPISSWLAHSVLYGQQDVDYLVYPSLGVDRVRCNLAFHPNFIDRFVQLDCVARIVLTDVDPHLNYQVESIGTIRWNQIEWEKPTRENSAWIGGVAV